MKNGSSSSDPEFIKRLRDLESHKPEYPAELLAARRASFIQQMKERSAPAGEEGLTSEDQQVVNVLKRWTPSESEYPAELLTKRRAAFLDQVEQAGRASVWSVLLSTVRAWFANRTRPAQTARAALLALGMAMAAFVAFALVQMGDSSSKLAPSANGIPLVEPLFTTATPQAAVICKNGYQPPLCLAQEFDNGLDLTFAGNGSARPAVAKDTVQGYAGIHRAAYVNDGLYGPGASWVSETPDSWIKIDLGRQTSINTVTFGRDRLGKLNDRDPGQFVIAVAVSDDVYADGNSSNDEREYVVVYDSEQSGFDGTISGSETVLAQFDLLEARFIKLTFENAGTAIDEVEAFVSLPPIFIPEPTRTPRDPSAAHTVTPFPSDTPIPSPTATPVPTDTPLPTDTPTTIPTDTPLPTDTPVPTSTETPVPTDEVFPFFTQPPLPTTIATDIPGLDDIIP